MFRYVSGIARFSALIIISLALISCGKNTSSALPNPSGNFAIATSGFAPVVLVVLPNSGGICTGTFVSERAVLTAAHCTLQNGTYTIMSSFGNFATTTFVRMGAGVVNDPNDISIIYFNTNIANRALGQVYDFGNSVATGDTLRLVGFGCNDLIRRSGAGTKRTGTNVVASVNDYVEFLTPASSAGYSARGILGPENRAASCFGDSGGPALTYENGSYKVIAVTHAGGIDGSEIVSQYVNVADRNDNRAALAQANADYNLGIQGL